MAARKNKGINFSTEEHMAIAAIRRRLITAKDKDLTMAETVMEGIKLLERKMK